MRGTVTVRAEPGDAPATAVTLELGSFEQLADRDLPRRHLVLGVLVGYHVVHRLGVAARPSAGAGTPDP